MPQQGFARAQRRTPSRPSSSATAGRVSPRVSRAKRLASPRGGEHANIYRGQPTTPQPAALSQPSGFVPSSKPPRHYLVKASTPRQGKATDATTAPRNNADSRPDVAVPPGEPTAGSSPARYSAPSTPLVGTFLPGAGSSPSQPGFYTMPRPHTAGGTGAWGGFGSAAASPSAPPRAATAFSRPPQARVIQPQAAGSTAAHGDLQSHVQRPAGGDDTASQRPVSPTSSNEGVDDRLTHAQDAYGSPAEETASKPARARPRTANSSRGARSTAWSGAAARGSGGDYRSYATHRGEADQATDHTQPRAHRPVSARDTRPAAQDSLAYAGYRRARVTPGSGVGEAVPLGFGSTGHTFVSHGIDVPPPVGSDSGSSRPASVGTWATTLRSAPAPVASQGKASHRPRTAPHHRRHRRVPPTGGGGGAALVRRLAGEQAFHSAAKAVGAPSSGVPVSGMPPLVGSPKVDIPSSVCGRRVLAGVGAVLTVCVCVCVARASIAFSAEVSTIHETCGTLPGTMHPTFAAHRPWSSPLVPLQLPGCQHLRLPHTVACTPRTSHRSTSHLPRRWISYSGALLRR